ncbi:uncharacterized protein LOC110104946 [Dendrobium catenatum]|uniref:uncharacterized protein LOC110104946 n=1 Tax=Dendrobium catenatum TaxID=906689 RepID=UPI0009F6E38C|nr:uncharacterized protein LOC110104946 [Dendrobium catenatum]
MPEIIHHSQAAFIANRVSSDNTILAAEVLGFISKNCKDKFLCAKFDIKKAFDTVSREFLFKRLEQKGPPMLFIQWIIACISDINFSICIDGGLNGFFGSSSGIRQCCPLSPFLFCFVVDALSCLIDGNSTLNRFQGFQFGDFQLTHLTYADDLLIFGKAETQNCDNLMNTLQTFSSCSVLILNLNKSSLLISPTASHLSAISLALQIHNCSTTISYLGLPISLGRVKLSDFSPLIKKITNLLSGWKVKLLSFAGRLQFIKYTITNLVAYWVRGSIIPKTIVKAIDKACSKFLFQRGDQSKRLHLISWKHTTMPHSNGGLGIASLQALRSAYNCVTILRMYNQDSQLSNWLKNRYNSPWKPSNRNCSAFWKNIQITATRFKHNFKFNVLANSPIATFWDHWCPHGSFIDSFLDFPLSSVNAESLTLASWMCEDSWFLPNFLNHHIMEFFTSIPISVGNANHITWENNENASFKDFYREFFCYEYVVDWAPLVWHKKHSLRHSVYSWLALSNGLKTSENLRIRNVITEDFLCPLCHQTPETTAHLLFECDYSFIVLTRLIPKMKCFLFRPNMGQALQFIDGLDVNRDFKSAVLLLLNITIYVLWTERNDRIHKGTLSCAPGGLLGGDVLGFCYFNMILSGLLCFLRILGKFTTTHGMVFWDASIRYYQPMLGKAVIVIRFSSFLWQFLAGRNGFWQVSKLCMAIVGGISVCFPISSIRCCFVADKGCLLHWQVFWAEDDDDTCLSFRMVYGQPKETDHKMIYNLL